MRGEVPSTVTYSLEFTSTREKNRQKLSDERKREKFKGGGGVTK